MSEILVQPQEGVLTVHKIKRFEPSDEIAQRVPVNSRLYLETRSDQTFIRLPTTVKRKTPTFW